MTASDREELDAAVNTLVRRLLDRRTAPDHWDGRLASSALSTATAAVFVAYFLGGFFIYSAMFAAVGAMSSSEQEAQQAQQPIALMLLLSFFSLFALGLSAGQEITHEEEA